MENTQQILSRIEKEELIVLRVPDSKYSLMKFLIQAKVDISVGLA